jgi:hypothetical protein
MLQILDLPSELIREILKFISPDQKTIAAIRLVCKDLEPFANEIFFKKISLRVNVDQAGIFRNIVRSEWYRPHIRHLCFQAQLGDYDDVRCFKSRIS